MIDWSTRLSPESVRAHWGSAGRVVDDAAVVGHRDVVLGLTVSCGRKADDGSLSKTFVLCSSDPRSWSPSLPACLAGFNQVFKSPRMRSRAKKQAWQYAVGGVDGNGCAGDRLVIASSPEEPMLLVAWGWLRDGSPGLRDAGCSCQQCPRCSWISRHC